MPYHGLPYFVTKSTAANRSNGPYASEQRSMPDRMGGIHYPASSRNARNLPPYHPCNTVRSPHAHGTRAHAKPALSDVQPLRVLTALLFMVLIALVCTLAGIGIAHVLTGTADSIFINEQASAPDAASPTTASSSTPSSNWKQGTIPQLYVTDSQWSSRPYGSSTIGNAGSAALCLAMVRISLTGDTTTGPVEIASLAQRQGYANSHDATMLLTDGTKEVGLVAQPVEASELAIRRQINAGFPVICAVESEAFGNHHIYVVLASIDERGQLVINDPTSPERSAKSWNFNDIMPASTALWSYRLIS